MEANRSALHPCSSADDASSRTDATRGMSLRDPCHVVLTSIAALIARALAGFGIASASAPQGIVVTATKATSPPVGTWDALCEHVADVSNLTVTLDRLARELTPLRRSGAPSGNRPGASADGRRNRLLAQNRARGRDLGRRRPSNFCDAAYGVQHPKHWSGRLNAIRVLVSVSVAGDAVKMPPP